MGLIRRIKWVLKGEPNDPQRDPNWCFMHGMMWPSCANLH